MTDIQTGQCESDPRGHIIGASGMCQWCHEDRIELEHKWMQSHVATLTARLGEAEARVTELTKQLAMRCCAENCDKEELLTADREQRADLTLLRGLLREVADEWDRINGWIMQHPTRPAMPITLLRKWRNRVTAALEGKP